MSGLIALRNRVRDMLAEQEADFWLDYSRAEMCEVLTVEMTALMDLEIEHEMVLEEQEIRSRYPVGASLRPATVLKWKNRMDSALMTHNSYVNLIKKAREQISLYKLRIESLQRQLESGFQAISQHWDLLTEAERAFLDRPTPNPTSVPDFPNVSHTVERGCSYPEATAKRRVQMRKLRDTLEFLERDIAAQEGEA